MGINQYALHCALKHTCSAQTAEHLFSDLCLPVNVLTPDLCQTRTIQVAVSSIFWSYTFPSFWTSRGAELRIRFYFYVHPPFFIHSVCSYNAIAGLRVVLVALYDTGLLSCRADTYTMCRERGGAHGAHCVLSENSLKLVSTSASQEINFFLIENERRKTGHSFGVNPALRGNVVFPSKVLAECTSSPLFNCNQMNRSSLMSSGSGPTHQCVLNHTWGSWNLPPNPRWRVL